MRSPPSFKLGQSLLGGSLKCYISFVEASTRWVVDEGQAPPWDNDSQLIALTWHGRQFLGNAALRRHLRRSLLVAPHRDGELIGDAARRAGFRVISGSGAAASPEKSLRKRGAAAFRSMISDLQERRAVLMTADVPKVSRVAGQGAIKLAQLSGAPIHCFAAVTGHRYELNNWDRTQFVLPFGRGAILWSPAIVVSPDASSHDLENARIEVETTLDKLHRRADAIVGINNGIQN